MAHVVETNIIETHLANLGEMSGFGGPALTTGLTDEVIRDFLECGYHDLSVAIERATRAFKLTSSHTLNSWR